MSDEYDRVGDNKKVMQCISTSVIADFSILLDRLGVFLDNDARLGLLTNWECSHQRRVIRIC